MYMVKNSRGIIPSEKIRRQNEAESTWDLPPSKNIFCCFAGVAVPKQGIFGVITKLPNRVEFPDPIDLLPQNTIEELGDLSIHLTPVHE
jgi:hypothetical protein